MKKEIKEWFIKDLKDNFKLYNLMNVYDLKLSLQEKILLYGGSLSKMPHYAFNYKKEKFLLIPSFLVRTSEFSDNRDYVYCGGGKIIINNKYISKKIVLRINTDFLPVGLCFISLDDNSICDKLHNYMLSKGFESMFNDATVENRDMIFKSISRFLSIASMEYLVKKIFKI